MKRQINKDAMKQLKYSIKGHFWLGDEDKEMQDAHECDRADLKHVLKLYEEGKWKKCYKFARPLDTAVRELIPQEIYEAIESAYHDGL